MALIRWEPAREINSLQHEMNRLFSASEFLGVSNATSKPALASARGMRAVPVQRVAVQTSRSGMLTLGPQVGRAKAVVSTLVAHNAAAADSRTVPSK